MYKEGDVLVLYNNWRAEYCIFILHRIYNDDWIEAHAKYSLPFKKLGVGANNASTNVKYSTGCLRKADEDEREFLLEKMKEKVIHTILKRINCYIHSIMKKEEIKINEHCEHYFLGFCHFYLGGCCSGIKCGYK